MGLTTPSEAIEWTATAHVPSAEEIAEAVAEADRPAFIPVRHEPRCSRMDQRSTGR